jgi:hypothetical protein
MAMAPRYRPCASFALLALAVGGALGAGCGGDRSLHVPTGGAGASAAGNGGEAGNAAGTSGNAGGSGAAGSGDLAGVGGGAGTLDACAVARDQYDRLRARFVSESDASTCQADSDCKLIDLDDAVHNHCNNPCGGTSIIASLAAEYVDTLTVAAKECIVCNNVTNADCEPLVAVCANGQCTRAPATSVSGVTPACQDARAAYANNRMTLLSKYGSVPCHADTECATVVEFNGCVSNCGIPLPVSTTSFFTTNLQTDADRCDAVCPPPLAIPCPMVGVGCVNGLCQSGPGDLGIP